MDIGRTQCCFLCSLCPSAVQPKGSENVIHVLSFVLVRHAIRPPWKKEKITVDFFVEVQTIQKVSESQPVKMCVDRAGVAQLTKLIHVSSPNTSHEESSHPLDRCSCDALVEIVSFES